MPSPEEQTYSAVERAYGQGDFARALELALAGLLANRQAPEQALQRRALLALQAANQRQLLQHWLGLQGVSPLPAEQLRSLLRRLEPMQGPGSHALAGGRGLNWDRQHLWLIHPNRP